MLQEKKLDPVIGEISVEGQLKSYREGRKTISTYWTTWSWKDCCCRGTCSMCKCDIPDGLKRKDHFSLLIWVHTLLDYLSIEVSLRSVLGSSK